MARSGWIRVASNRDTVLRSAACAADPTRPAARAIPIKTRFMLRLAAVYRKTGSLRLRPVGGTCEDNAKLASRIHRGRLHEGLTTLPGGTRPEPDFKQPVGSCAR